MAFLRRRVFDPARGSLAAYLLRIARRQGFRALDQVRDENRWITSRSLPGRIRIRLWI